MLMTLMLMTLMCWQLRSSHRRGTPSCPWCWPPAWSPACCSGTAPPPTRTAPAARPSSNDEQKFFRKYLMLNLLMFCWDLESNIFWSSAVKMTEGGRQRLYIRTTSVSFAKTWKTKRLIFPFNKGRNILDKTDCIPKFLPILKFKFDIKHNSLRAI